MRNKASCGLGGMGSIPEGKECVRTQFRASDEVSLKEMIFGKRWVKNVLEVVGK